jgi:hypothetical protein
MDTKLEDWVANAEVKTTDKYDALNPQDYYTKLLAHQEEIDAQLEALQSPAPTDSAAPAADSAAPAADSAAPTTDSNGKG